jgi:hypothetical protein
MASSIAHIGDKLVVGALDVSFLSATSRIFPGTAVLNGPVYIGLPASIGIPRATCMIGPPIGIGVPASLEVIGITNIIGVVNRIAVANVTGLTSKVGITIRNALSLSNSINIKNGMNQGNKFNTFTTVIVDRTLTANKILTPYIDAQFGRFSSVAAPFKLFDIPHPNKSGMRLRHACIEGPEVAVYYRGRLIGNNVIELPDYWHNLIDPETITVSFTSHTYYQELYVKNVEWGRKINVVNNTGGGIDCSYIVYAERKDVEKLEIEYKE